MPTLWKAVPVINTYQALMLGMKAVPFIGDLSTEAERAILYVAMDLQTIPLLAPRYGETTIKLDETSGTISMWLKASLFHIEQR